MAKGPICGDTGKSLNGIPHLRSRKYHTLTTNKKTVKRAYGGSRTGNAVKDRITRAFLIEELKILKKQAQIRKEKKKTVTKPKKDDKKKAK